MTEVTICLPDDIADVLVDDGEALDRHILEATALQDYSTGKLSHAQVGRLLGLSRFEVDAFLKSHNVPLNYTIEDLEEDRRTLNRLSLK